jgi:hypothetical protein
MATQSQANHIVVLASSFYTAALERPFVQAQARRGDPSSVVCVPYNQLHAFLLDPHPFIPVETPASVILLVRVEDLIRLELANTRSPDANACLRTFREQTAQFLDVLSRISGLRLVLLVCPSGRGAYDVSFLGNAVRVAEHRIAAELRRQQGHRVVEWSDFERRVPGTSIFNVAGDRLGHVPYLPEGLDALAEFFVGQIADLPTTTLKAQSKDGSNASFQQFLARLGVELIISPLIPEDEAAAIDLIRHTTHFINTPDRKWAAGDLGATMGRDGEGWIIRVRDRFGDNGVSGAMTFTFDGESTRLGFWFLTCPVLGKQVEYALMNWIARAAELRGATSIEVPFVNGRDNHVLYAFLAQLEAAGPKATVAELPRRDQRTFRLPVAGLKELAIANAPNPAAAAAIASKICTVEKNFRVGA